MGVFPSKELFEGECLFENFDPGHYESEGAKLGEGAYGQVTRLDRVKKSPKNDVLPPSVALKVVQIRSPIGDDRREYKILKECDHENILKLYYWKIVKVPIQKDQLLMYTELCNFNLSTFMADYQLSMEEIKYLCFQMVDGCKYLHSQEVVHGDIKPANILVKHGRGNPKNVLIKLADFGLAQFMPANITSSHQYTATGTRAYASPEIIKALNMGKKVELKCPFATDIFSLGVVIFEMITKKRPFDLAELGQTNHDPRQMIESNVLDSNMKECLIKMLQWNPKRRIETKMLSNYFSFYKLKTYQFHVNISTIHYIEELDVLIVGCKDGSIFSCNNQGEKKEMEKRHTKYINCIKHHDRYVVICDYGCVSLWELKIDQLVFLKIL